MPGLRDQGDAALGASLPIRDRRRMPLKKSVAIGGLRFKAYRVQHSIRAPAVGYRVSTKAGSFFYMPDVARLPNIAEALGGVGVYIGDGATMRRSMVRVKERTLVESEEKPTTDGGLERNVSGSRTKLPICSQEPSAGCRLSLKRWGTPS